MIIEPVVKPKEQVRILMSGASKASARSGKLVNTSDGPGRNVQCSFFSTCAIQSNPSKSYYFHQNAYKHTPNNPHHGANNNILNNHPDVNVGNHNTGMLPVSPSQNVMKTSLMATMVRRLSAGSTSSKWDSVEGGSLRDWDWERERRDNSEAGIMGR